MSDLDYNVDPDLNHEPRSRSGSRSRSMSRSEYGSSSPSHSLSKSPSVSAYSEGESDEVESGKSAEVVDDHPPSVINFCSRHKTSLVPEECAACRSADNANKAVKPLVPPLEDFPSADKRFNTTRSDEKPSTLNLSDSTINVMDSVFTAGKFRSAKHFEACCLKIFI